MIIEVKSEDEMKSVGKSIGLFLKGGEIIELIGDIGAGKTILTKGIATGLGIEENVQSPSFTISRVYKGRDNLFLAHYDYYRLADAGIMTDELHENTDRSDTITVIEWAGIVAGVLPDDRLTIQISTIDEFSRSLEISAGGLISNKLLGQLSK